MAVHKSGETPDPESFRRFAGPGQVDQIIRNAIQVCWMLLPNEKKTAADLEREIRRLVDRALKDLHEDERSFKKP